LALKPPETPTKADDLDLLGPAHFTLERDGLGRLGFLAIEAGLDYRVGKRTAAPPWNSPSRGPTKATGSPGAAGPPSQTVTGDSFEAANSFRTPQAVTMRTRSLQSGTAFTVDLPPHSVSVLTLPRD
jgi:hypothetical protein